MRAYVEATPSREGAAEDDYTGLYSDELRDLVAERDAQLIARYGYRFGA
jgi:hypothetical protein